MSRTSILAVTAIAALTTSCLVSTDASAWGRSFGAARASSHSRPSGAASFHSGRPSFAAPVPSTNRFASHPFSAGPSAASSFGHSFGQRSFGAGPSAAPVGQHPVATGPSTATALSQHTLGNVPGTVPGTSALTHNNLHGAQAGLPQNQPQNNGTVHGQFDPAAAQKSIKDLREQAKAETAKADKLATDAKAVRTENQTDLAEAQRLGRSAQEMRDSAHNLPPNSAADQLKQAAQTDAKAAALEQRVKDGNTFASTEERNAAGLKTEAKNDRAAANALKEALGKGQGSGTATTGNGAGTAPGTPATGTTAGTPATGTTAGTPATGTTTGTPTAGSGTGTATGGMSQPPKVVIKFPGGPGQFPGGGGVNGGGFGQSVAVNGQSSIGFSRPSNSAPVAPAPVAQAPVAQAPAYPAPAYEAPAPSCLRKVYLQADTVMFKDVCTKEWAINSTSVTDQVPTKRRCLTKENPREGVVLFKDLCTNEWAQNPAVGNQAAAH